MKAKTSLLLTIAMVSLTGCTLSYDLCPDDPRKEEPGVCGCGVPDKDKDGDSIPDCVDKLPDLNDNEDVDNDGIINIEDPCPMDASNNCCKDGIDGKEKPGFCGCDQKETDSDKDTVPDCVDVCKDDPDKALIEENGKLYEVKIVDGAITSKTSATNTCGCGVSEPTGLCGCGEADTDTDGDKVPDCVDVCKDDADKALIKEGDKLYAVTIKDGAIDTKTESTNICGCGTPETDSDGDKVPDCNDVCDDNPNKKQRQIKDNANAITKAISMPIPITMAHRIALMSAKTMAASRRQNNGMRVPVAVTWSVNHVRRVLSIPPKAYVDV